MRPDHDSYFMALALVAASRSTCLRRAVGCVLVDARHHVLATGYNGVAAGQPHCNERVIKFIERDPTPAEAVSLPIGSLSCAGRIRVIDGFDYPHACDGACAKSGTQLDACQAIHAEQNALVQCRDPYAIETVYCTTEPCVSCTKLLLGTSVRRVVYLEPYAGGGHDLWTTGRADWRGLTPPAWFQADQAAVAAVLAGLTASTGRSQAVSGGSDRSGGAVTTASQAV